MFVCVYVCVYVCVCVCERESKREETDNDKSMFYVILASNLIKKPKIKKEY